MDNRKGPQATNQTTPPTWNEITAELTKCKSELSDIVNRFEQVHKNEHQISMLEFQNWVRRGFELIATGFENIIELTALTEQPEKEPLRTGTGG